MRVTLGEIYFGQAAVFMGALQLGDGKAFVRGYPVPLWTSYILISAGLLIPLLAWYLRRPLQQTVSHKESYNTVTVMPTRSPCCLQHGTIIGDAGFGDNVHNSCDDDPENRLDTFLLSDRNQHIAIKKHMMIVTFAEIYWGHLFVFLGAVQIGAYKAHMVEYPMPLSTAYIILAAGMFLPLLAWYMRRPLQNTESNNH